VTLSLLFIVGGLAALVFGADLLIRGVSAMASRLGVPSLVIGLTVVAFGTSMPEVVVNVMAATSGSTELAFGNLVGSSAINIGFVLAMTALVRPLNVDRSLVVREIPLLLLVVAAWCVLLNDQWLLGATGNSLSRQDGVVLILLFLMFLYLTVRSTLTLSQQTVAPDGLIEEVRDRIKDHPKVMGWTLAAVLTVIGLVGVAGGGRLAVMGAVDVATRWGISPTLIGLTIVSFGTTLPELATCIAAARRGQGDIALGNVVGSNLFNLMFIGGTVAIISPVSLPPGGWVDLSVMAVLSALLLPLAIRQSKLLRSEAALLLVIYFAYLIGRVFWGAGE
jgi:cation:H+ antiporter